MYDHVHYKPKKTSVKQKQQYPKQWCAKLQEINRVKVVSLHSS